MYYLLSRAITCSVIVLVVFAHNEPPTLLLHMSMSLTSHVPTLATLIVIYINYNYTLDVH